VIGLRLLERLYSRDGRMLSSVDPGSRTTVFEGYGAMAAFGTGAAGEVQPS
jgi:hypothetical protein